MKKCRLVYKSTAKPELFEDGALEKLAESASNRNEDYGITGLLILTGDQILQVLEGPNRFVNQLYNRIVIDPRHGDIELISFESAESPLFTEWSMRFVSLSKLSESVQELFQKKYTYKNGALSVPNDKLGALSLLIDVQNAGLFL